MENILVIDDDPDILDAIKFTLEDAGFKATFSLKGEAAEKLINKKRQLPDLIILDVLLSGKDGRDICRKLKTEKQTKGIHILMISAHPDARESSLAAGAEDFLAKPFDIDMLLKKVEVYAGNPHFTKGL